MSNSTSFDWVEFYGELARILLPYKDHRDDLITKVRQIFEIADISMPTLEKDNNLVDIDPFTIFALFNKNMKDSNRKKIIAAVAEVFAVKAPLPTSFDSIPVLNPLNSTFYTFIDERGEHYIDELWDFYVAALNYVDDPSDKNKETFSDLFDLVINKKGIGTSKITIALYWIAPDTYLNLDSRNRWFIYDSRKIPEEIVKTLPKVSSKITAACYFDISDKVRNYLQSGACEWNDFKELSFEAWRYSEEVNKKKKEEEKLKTALPDEDDQTVHYWIYSPGDNATKWDEFYNAGIMAIGWTGIGDLRQYETREDMKKAMKSEINPDKPYKFASLATWQFANKMKIGDIVFAKKGMYKIVGRGVVTSDYEFDPDRDDFNNVRQVDWTNKGEWPHPGQAVQKTLTDITPYTEYVEKLNALFQDEETDDEDETEISYDPYSEEEFLNSVYMSRTDYETLTGLLDKKKNVILEGAPGVGKTYAAVRLAYSIIKEQNPKRVMMIQFHQSYSYEDFIMGFRPTETGFELRNGVFYNFCKAAEEDLENKYFFIIDEINRGNLSKIFGELFMLIENDKRNSSIQLLYSNEKFSIPKNVYIIGMMNTADRSLAMMDYALRRRFAFFEMKPAFESDGFKAYQKSFSSPKFDSLIKRIEELNEDIASDDSLGEGFCIGHSYFCDLGDVTDKTLSSIVEYEIIPLLKEYWFDNPVKVSEWSGKLRSTLK